MMNQVGGKVIFFFLPSNVIVAVSTSPFACQWDASIGDYDSEMDCQDQGKIELVSCKATKEPG